MMKEMIQKLVKEPEARMQFQNGQLQLAGMTSWERSAFMDIIEKWNPSNSRDTNVKETYWGGRYWF